MVTKSWYKPIQLPPKSIEFSSDASKYDFWGVVMGNVSTGGAWTASEFEIHINIKEMIAIFYALRSFVDKLSGQHGRVQCDNTTAVSVINNMGITHCPECNTIAQKIWQFCRQNNICITCAYIPGSENIFPDIESRKQYKNAKWMLNRKLYLLAIKLS